MNAKYKVFHYSVSTCRPLDVLRPEELHPIPRWLLETSLHVPRWRASRSRAAAFLHKRILANSPRWAWSKRLLHRVGPPGTIREGARKGHGTQLLRYNRTALARRAPRTEEGYCPWRPGGICFVVYEVEGSIRVGEHRLRHLSSGTAATACRGREGAAAERSSLV